MLRIGPYREVYESHRKSFLETGYSEHDAGALAQLICAQPLPEFALNRTAHFLETAIPNAEIMLEYDQYTGITLKVQEAVTENSDMFRDDDDPKGITPLVSGVYPGEPGMAVVKVLETGEWYAVDWSLNDSSDVELANVRDIGTYYDTLSVSVTEGLMPAIDLVLYEREMKLRAEQAFLVACISEEEFEAPGVVLDGTRPVEEMEFVKFLRNSKVLTESFTAPFDVPDQTFVPSVDEPFGRLAIVSRRLDKLETSSFALQLMLAMPRVNSTLTEVSTTLQSVVISKDKFTKSEVAAMAKRNSWKTENEDTATSYRLRQFDPALCEAGSFKTIPLKAGVQGIICQRKTAKNERANGRRHRLTEAAEFPTTGGGAVFVDEEKAAAGDMEDVAK